MRVKLEDLQNSYAAMADEELRSLASQSSDLNDEARQALENELHRRGLHSASNLARLREGRKPESATKGIATGLTALFWAYLMTPITPLLVGGAGFHSLRYLYRSHSEVIYWMPFVWSLRAIEALAIIFWVLAIRVGFRKLRELSRMTRATNNAIPERGDRPLSPQV